jgi:predicted kinase
VNIRAVYNQNPVRGQTRQRPEVVIFIGAQGSGKTTLYRDRFAATHLHISKDLLPRNADRRRRQRQLIAEALDAGRSIVVDNTHPAREDRSELVDLARARRARVVAYYFEAPLADCLRRNALREGTARVPRVAVVSTHKRLQPPSLDEGFDALYVARLLEQERAFEITRVR